MNADHCLINQTACGRIQGDPVCPKCGMDERVVYPGQADLESALEAARGRYVAAQEAMEPPAPPEPPKPPPPPEPPLQPLKQADPEPRATEKRGLNRLGLGALVIALLGGAWWWKDQQDQRLKQAEEQVASQALAVEQARSEREAEKKRADEAEAERVAAENVRMEIVTNPEKGTKQPETARSPQPASQALVAEQARSEREAEKKRADEVEAKRVTAEKARAEIATNPEKGTKQPETARSPQSEKDLQVRDDRSMGALNLGCTNTHAPKSVRYWKLYSFHNTWNNDSSSTTYLHKFHVDFINANYLSAGKKFSDGSLFSWTKELRNSSYAISPNSKMKYLETFSEDWGVVQKPERRADIAKGEYDFLILYKTHFDKTNNTSTDAPRSVDVSCQPYFVTWLGDGVVDERYEKCDPEDSKKSGWGRNGCDPKLGIPID